MLCRDWVGPCRLSKLPGRFLKESPSLFAELRFPLGIKARFTEHLTERRGIDIVEDEAFGSEVALKRRILPGDLFALCQGVPVDDRRHLILQVCRHALPYAPI